MMPILALFVAAGLMPSSGPEKISGEVVQDALDLSGKWEGTLDPYETSMDNGGQISVKYHPAFSELFGTEIVDEGDGRLRMQWGERNCRSTHKGIYRQNGDHLIICFQRADYGVPSTFRTDDRQYLLELRRIKKRK